VRRGRSLVLALALAVTSTATRALDEIGAVGLRLPPLATIEREDRSGATWRQQGTLPGGLPVARQELRRALAADGWRLVRTIPLGDAQAPRELLSWRRGERRVLVMLWQRGVGHCGFAWGEEKGDGVNEARYGG
jgi:hypothetical protein